jgi:hypothetical protein
MNVEVVVGQKFLDGMCMGSPLIRNWRDIDGHDSSYKPWITLNC